MSKEDSSLQPVVKGSLIFSNLVAIMKRGLFTGEDARLAAEAILFLEQVSQNEKSAEDAKEASGEQH